MIDKLDSKLWVLKFCLKIVYPKFNYYTFLVFLVIKYKVFLKKKNLRRILMDTFYVKAVPVSFIRLLIRDKVDENLPVLLHKCIVISREQFIQLSSENLFYIDNGVLWVALKLSPELKRVHNMNIKENIFRYNLNFLTSKIHQQLWTNNNAESVYNVRIVPIVGSKFVQYNIAYTTENEFYNTALTFGLQNVDNFDVSFHPIPSLESAPKITATAEVNMILNDYDLPNDFIKEILNNYFEMPKLVSLNDVFSIDLVPEITGKYHNKYLDLVESAGKLYFKCNKLNSAIQIDNDGVSNPKSHDYVIPAYFIVRGVTQLTLGENIHSIKPKDEYFKQSDSKFAELLRLCPTGLKHRFDQIQETISPFLSGDINELSSSMSSPIIPILLLSGRIGSGRHLLVKTLAKCNGMNCLQLDCNGLQSSTAKQTESKINATIQKAKAASPVIVMLDNFEVFAVDPENNEDCRIMEYFINSITDLYQNYTKHPIIFIALTEKLDLKPNILRIFLEKFHIPRLNNEQRYEMLQWFASVMQLNIDEEQEKSHGNIIEKYSDKTNLSKHSKEVLQRIAAKTETFLYGDIDTLVHFAVRESYLKQRSAENQPLIDPNFHLVSEDDFNSALESIRSLHSQHLDAPKIPKVYWQDIGGLDKLKKELLKTIEFPIKYPHLFKNSSLKRSGILLYGPPGCGKTLVAKAVSTELNVSFLSVKGPELLNMYIGQSEENVRNVFESARASSPCIIFLDELDALAPRRGAAGDSGGASDRVVSQLLAELDGVASGEDADTNSFVFVMGATNRPDLLEQSLLRPGRLDKLIYVGPYAGQDEKTSVLRALSRNYNLSPEVSLDAVASSLPERCTGADLLHVVSTARSSAVRNLVAKLRAESVKESELSPDSIVLSVGDFLQGVSTFRPSVTDQELAYYETLQTQM